MKKLLKNGKQYGAKFGVHINAGETYPESKAFNPDRLRKMKTVRIIMVGIG